MPMFERVELARAIADRHGHRMTDLEGWMPLLRYTEGNPLTITILVGQALREGLNTEEQIEKFVEQLRSGEKEIEDDESQGRSKTLEASLSYGSQNVFDEKERRVLALLSFFQGFVDVDVLMLMGQGSFSLEELWGLERNEGMKLLDRASEVGMLTTLGGGNYRIHPALPWFFHRLFQQYYQDREEEAARAFVETIAFFADLYKDLYQAGHPAIISLLAAEEANLLYARRLALKKGWWTAVISTMQGLVSLYDQTGRWMWWKELVEEVIPFFVDQQTDGSIPGRESVWNVVNDYRVKLAIRSQNWAEALRLQEKSIGYTMKEAGPALDADPHQLDERNLKKIRNYIVSKADLAQIQLSTGDMECVQSYRDVIEKSEKYGFRQLAAAYSMNLGGFYAHMAESRDLDQAESWFKRSLDITDPSDSLGRGRCLGNLGYVALMRYMETEAAGRPDGEHLKVARELYKQSLEILPQNAAKELAITHNCLGKVYHHAGIFDEALRGYQEAIGYADELGDLYWAAQYRRNASFCLKNAGRLSDALEYALSAREKFENCGPAGAKEVQETQNLIDKFEEDLRSK
jgi:tetratricopeptide (TPR) repeat protein